MGKGTTAAELDGARMRLRRGGGVERSGLRPGPAPRGIGRAGVHHHRLIVRPPSKLSRRMVKNPDLPARRKPDSAKRREPIILSCTSNQSAPYHNLVRSA